MTEQTITAEEIARQLAERNSRVYTLEEVAERTRSSLRALQIACREDRVEFTKIGRTRGMTLAQIDLYVAGFKAGKVATEAVSEEAEAIALSLRSASRTRKKTAA